MALSKNEIINSSLSLIETGVKIKIHAKGVSMYPALRKGDELVIKKVPIEELVVGDIIAFNLGSDIIAHRIIQIDKQKTVLKTKGDSCYKSDPKVSEENYTGKVVAFIRKGKTTSLLNTRWKVLGKAIVLLTPVLPLVYKIARAFRRAFMRK